MKLRIVLGILVGVLLLQIASAHYYGDIDNYHTSNFAYHYNPRTTGEFCLSFNSQGCDHNYPRYRYHDLGSWNFDRDRDDDWKERYQRQRTVRWIDNSFRARYDIASGRASGEVFGGTDRPALSSSNWRYKEAYDPRVDGLGRGSDYYYKPRYDSERGYYNWRY